jgi:hypothetical protein
MNSYLSVPPLFSCFHFVSQPKQLGVLEVGVSSMLDYRTGSPFILGSEFEIHT